MTRAELHNGTRFSVAFPQSKQNFYWGRVCYKPSEPSCRCVKARVSAHQCSFHPEPVLCPCVPHAQNATLG